MKILISIFVCFFSFTNFAIAESMYPKDYKNFTCGFFLDGNNSSEISIHSCDYDKNQCLVDEHIKDIEAYAIIWGIRDSILSLVYGLPNDTSTNHRFLTIYPKNTKTSTMPMTMVMQSEDKPFVISSDPKKVLGGASEYIGACTFTR